MTVGSEQLQSLQPERADQYDGRNQNNAPGVGQTERQTDNCKRGEML